MDSAITYKYYIKYDISIIGVNKEYVSFGGGGAVVFDALHTADRANSMSEGYNAGLPSRAAPLPVQPEQMSKAVPHSAQELISNQEIIKDVSATQPQKEAAAFLNRQEAGEVGLGREVPMQKANLLSPYGRELRYQGDVALKANGAIQGMERAQANRDDQKPFRLEANKGQFQEINGGKELDKTVSSEEHHDLEGIPTEAESDNEPMPDEAMSIAGQAGPFDSAGVPQNSAMQKGEKFTKEQETGRMAEETKQRDMPRFRGADDKEQAMGSQARMESPLGNKQHEGLRSTDVSSDAFQLSGQSQATYIGHTHGEKNAYPGSMAEGNKEKPGNEIDVKHTNNQQAANVRDTYQERTASENKAYYDSKPQKNLNAPASQHLQLESEKQRQGFKTEKTNFKNMEKENRGADQERTVPAEKDVHQRGENTQISQRVSPGQDALNGNRDSAFQENARKFFGTKDDFRERGETGQLSSITNRIAEQRGMMHGEDGIHENAREPPCKHCNINPEVTFKLESSDAESGPLKCKGCGPNPKFTPVVENLGLKMSVNDKTVSPKVPQTMTPVPMPQTKAEVTTDNQGRARSSDVADTRDGFAGIHEPMGQMEKGFETSLHKQMTENKLGTSRDQSGHNLSRGQDLSHGYDLSHGQRVSQGAESLEPQQAKPSSHQSSATEYEGSPNSMAMKEPAAGQIQGSLLRDTPGASTVMRFANKGDDGAPSANHKTERVKNDAKNIAKQEEKEDKEGMKNNEESLIKSSQAQSEKGPQTEGTSSTINAKETGSNVGVAGFSSKPEPSNASSGGKGTNITTLVEIISKGMKALRESDFDIEEGSKMHGYNGGGSKESNDSKNVTEGKNQNRDDKENGKQGDAIQQSPKKLQEETQNAAGNAATKPGEMMTQMHGGKHGATGDVEAGHRPAYSKSMEGGTPDPDGNFSDDSLEYSKHAWHEKDCKKYPDQCKGFSKQSNLGPRPNGNNRAGGANAEKPSSECEEFLNLPEKQKRKLSKQKMKRYKRICILHHHSSDAEPLDVADIKSDDGGPDDKPKQKQSGQKTANLDKLNLSVAKLKIASLLSQETPEKTAPPGFHPGYTTMAFEHGAVIPEKKMEEMPDTAETFVSRTSRPDYSSLAGESAGKNSEMSYYFNQKNDQKEKDMLMRALPESNRASAVETNLNNPFGGKCKNGIIYF